RYRVLHDLHSFPTRRSSDLKRVRRGNFRSLRVLLIAKTAVRVLFRWAVPFSALIAGREPCNRYQDSSRALRVQVIRPQISYDLSDRKSTRLNSSHSQISYAV